jgi:hypothetical protein
MNRPAARREFRPGFLLSFSMFALAVVLAAGCARESANPVSIEASSPGGPLLAQGGPDRDVVRQDGTTVPSPLALASFADQDLEFWPFTGGSLDGAGVDPINLVFVGRADPAQIRDALLSLDGNRAPLGFPAAYPWDQRWKDASGDVHTGFVDETGWVGSEIQLALGDYGPLRFHLRLFRTASPFGDGGVWTLGAAHFEILVPGTTEHRVISWERAEEIVAADLLRSGLLDASLPAGAAAVGPSPSWRDIEPFIYNELPAELRGYIGGPDVPVSAPVPLANDGQATVLHVAGAAPSAGDRHESFTVNMHQFVPRPFCSGGPLDFVLVDGPVAFSTDVTVDASGRVQVAGRASGTITVTPVDVTQSPPVPAGGSWQATVSDVFHGAIAGQEGRISFQVRRILPQDGGSEMVSSRLAVGTNGQNSFVRTIQCFSEDVAQR